MSKRDEIIEAMGFAAWMAYCGYGPTRPEPEYDGDDTPEMWDSAKNNWDEVPTLCTHIGRDGFTRCAAAALDAALLAMSNPDDAMIAEGFEAIRMEEKWPTLIGRIISASLSTLQAKA